MEGVALFPEAIFLNSKTRIKDCFGILKLHYTFAHSPREAAAPGLG